jgi:hypothetical protein
MNGMETKTTRNGGRSSDVVMLGWS